MTILNVSDAAYHADEVADAPSLSASIANLLITKSPAHAKAAHPKLNPDFERKPEDKFDLGSAVHSLLLEGKDAVYVCQFDSWRTNDAKETREYARSIGKIPLLAHEWLAVQPMFAAIREQLDQHHVDPTPFTAGKPEQTLVWEEGGVTLKARLDWLHDDRSATDNLKTTKASAEPRAWTRTCLGMGADVQAAFYLRGARHYGWDLSYRWVVVEVTPPFALSVCTPDSVMLDIANDKVDRAIALWRQCLANDRWPAYTTDVARLEPPAYAEAAWLERREDLEAA